LGAHHGLLARQADGYTPAPAAMLLEGEAIFHDALTSRSADMRIEVGALSIFDKVVAMVRAGAGQGGRAPVAGRDAARLDAARSLILSDVARSWAIKDVARAVALNERRLKQGFRERFGLPIHATLQAARLEKGRGLLLSGLSVTETSLAVGYANPSHFARLFRRAYGMRPSDLC
jgi:AraC-like DNA-binding protein